MGVEKYSGWTFYNECEIPQDISTVLAEQEYPVCAFKTVRDAAVFTNRRLIIRDAQGLTGKKVEMYSLPYSSINMWSTENAGKLLDFNASCSCGLGLANSKSTLAPISMSER